MTPSCTSENAVFADPANGSNQATALDLQDRLDDLLTGLRFWKEHKIAAMELTVLDEALIRWVEYNEAGAL